MNGGLRDSIFDEVLLGGHVVGQCSFLQAMSRWQEFSTIKYSSKRLWVLYNSCAISRLCNADAEEEDHETGFRTILSTSRSSIVGASTTGLDHARCRAKVRLRESYMIVVGVSLLGVANNVQRPGHSEGRGTAPHRWTFAQHCCSAMRLC